MAYVLRLCRRTVVMKTVATCLLLLGIGTIISHGRPRIANIDSKDVAADVEDSVALGGGHHDDQEADVRPHGNIEGDLNVPETPNVHKPHNADIPVNVNPSGLEKIHAVGKNVEIMAAANVQPAERGDGIGQLADRAALVGQIPDSDKLVMLHERVQGKTSHSPAHVPVRNHSNLHDFKAAHGMKLSDLQPADHMEAVKMEQDGHLNRDYLKEVFLGNHHEMFDDEDEDVVNRKLRDIFKKVNTNGDEFITDDELCKWIILKVQEHFDEATRENHKIFRMLDHDDDGYITWQEFHIQFLIAKGHAEDRAIQQVDDYEAIPLDAQDRELLIRHRFKWSDSDNEPQDNRLSVDEFRSFQHPEQSPNMMKRMVQDILENLDDNSDGKLTENEFAAMPQEDSDADWHDSDKMWQDERRKEFKNVIDLDGDSIVSYEELLKYVDPKNPYHASIEAKNLVELADDNEDGKLSLTEVLENAELFLGSKMMDTGRNFHDEF